MYFKIAIAEIPTSEVQVITLLCNKVSARVYAIYVSSHYASLHVDDVVITVSHYTSYYWCEASSRGREVKTSFTLAAPNKPAQSQ